MINKMNKKQAQEIIKQLTDKFSLQMDYYKSGAYNETQTRIDFLDPFFAALGWDIDNIKIDNKVIKNIITELYETGYNFAIIPVEILGYAYEQFLGKVIRRESGGQAVTEEKPEVRKAGGVYYTPDYIVKYIVENTVGKLINGKTPDEVACIKIIDPSCGSGSFLLGAYQYLLDWHLQYYRSEKTRKYEKTDTRRENPLTPEGNLSTKEKKRILLNNIYGVDIDAQAVEVAKLSLLLKVMECESEASIQTSLLLFHEPVLPCIDKNIQYGNSLISPDFYDDGLFLTPKEERKINVFDWQTAFPEICRQGGFDCVIGNPPYVLLQILERKEIFSYVADKYKSAHYKTDTYQLFIEKSVNILKPGGCLAYITPNTFLTNIHSEPLRKFILENTAIKEILLFYYKVFTHASVDVCITFLIRSTVSEKNKILIKEVCEEFKPVLKREMEQSTFNNNKRFTFSISLDGSEKQLIDKILKKSQPLSCFCGAYFGIQTWDKKKYVCAAKQNEHFRPVIDGGNIGRYTLIPPKEYVLFVPEAIKSGGKESIYRQNRLCTRQIGNYPIVTYVERGIFALNTVYNIYKTDENANLKFILAVMNSKIIQYYWKKTNSDEKKTFPKIKKEALLNIPIPEVDLSNPAEKSLHDRIAELAETMLALNKRVQTASLQSEKEQLQGRINHTDSEISQLVCKLYELTDKDMETVERNI